MRKENSIEVRQKTKTKNKIKKKQPQGGGPSDGESKGGGSNEVIDGEVRRTGSWRRIENVYIQTNKQFGNL